MAEVIDESGAVFGLVNIIDLLVVLFGVAVVVAGVALVGTPPLVPFSAIVIGIIALAGLARHHSESSHAEKRQESHRRIHMEISELHPAIADAINRGDSTQGSELTVIDEYHEPASVVVETDEGRLVEREHPRLRTASVTLRLQTKSDEQRFRGDQLYVGRTLQLELDQVRVEGMVVALDETTAETTDTREREHSASEQKVAG